MKRHQIVTILASTTIKRQDTCAPHFGYKTIETGDLKKLKLPPPQESHPIGRKRPKAGCQTKEKLVSKEETPYISATYQTTLQERLDLRQGLVSDESALGVNTA